MDREKTCLGGSTRKLHVGFFLHAYLRLCMHAEAKARQPAPTRDTFAAEAHFQLVLSA